MAKTFSVYDQRREQGFSLIEVMVAMVIGIIISAGIFEIFLTSKKSQDVVYDQVELMDESRITIELLSYDLKRAGLWGKTNQARTLWEGKGAEIIKSIAAELAASNDCKTSKGYWADNTGEAAMGWALDAYKGIYGVSESDILANGFPYSVCIQGQYLAGDALEIRYAGEKIAKDNLDNTTVYIVSQGQHSDFFFGGAPAQPDKAEFSGMGIGPDFPPVTYHKYEAVLYYVSAWGNGSSLNNDRIPALRRVSLQAGPELVDDIVLSGVENLKVQFGLDLDKNEDTRSVQQYFDPINIPEVEAAPGVEPLNDWSKIKSAQVWALVRSKQNRGLDNATSSTFSVPGGWGATTPDLADGYKRIMVSTASKLRNIEYVP